MITILFHMQAKAGREDDFVAQARDLVATTRAEDEGCINYSIYRQTDNPRQFVLFEQWRGPDALNAHITRLQRVLGPPDDQEPVPVYPPPPPAPESASGPL
jgi:quinol monooxygenase YgiN